jgi:ribonucleotide monophosphatase NagD (HAD superfamily)
MTEAELKKDMAFDAIMVFADVNVLELSLQTISDLVMSCNGRVASKRLLDIDEKQHVKLFVTNPDQVYAAEYPYPRFAGGMFTTCLQRLLSQTYNRQLEFTQYGKPSAATFAYARKQLERQAEA